MNNLHDQITMNKIEVGSLIWTRTKIKIKVVIFKNKFFLVKNLNAKIMKVKVFNNNFHVNIARLNFSFILLLNN